MPTNAKPVALAIVVASLATSSCGGSGAGTIRDAAPQTPVSSDATPGDSSACNSPASVVDVMTATNVPAPYAASGSPTYSSEYPVWSLFDGKTADSDPHWISSGLPAYAQIDAGAPKSVVAYTMVGRFDTLIDRLPKSWKLEGSNNASAGNAATWTVIDARSEVGVGMGGWSSTTYEASLSFVLPAPVRYSSFRLTVTEVCGSSVADLIELRLLSPCTDA